MFLKKSRDHEGLVIFFFIATLIKLILMTDLHPQSHMTNDLPLFIWVCFFQSKGKRFHNEFVHFRYRKMKNTTTLSVFYNN